MRKILTDAANIGAVTARTLAFRIREPEAFFYPNSSWRLLFFGGYSFAVSPGVANLDGATFHYSFATGVTPAMEEKMVGQGSPYPWASLDGKGNPLDAADRPAPAQRQQPGQGPPDQLGADHPRQGLGHVLRLYGALEPWFNKTWRPGAIELQS
ncbi:hypothetical protein [Synechococcus sp. BA-132 BA5]|uniref:hypothetical protein n=1 Tax=Synechococcus sp. BA-132 BA5 TaxID=3110252 RepID=UPI002B217BAB|nr:hypothetical protein [Synechococcus sp. BA-132 BA5]MEA5416929.1 hypothetical protein [Synechococcus sp. BA-132 BA5]